MVNPSHFNDKLARIYTHTSPDIDQTDVPPDGLGLANNALTPDLPRCTAARSTVVLSRSRAPGMGVALRLSFDLKAGEFAALRENLKPNFDQFVI